MVLPKKWHGFVVVRDLRDTLISAYFSFKISHPLLTKYNVDLRDKLNSLDMDNGLLYLMDTWLPACAEIQESWLDTNFEIIHYEDLLTDDLMILEKILIGECRIPLSKEKFKKVIVENRFKSASGGRERGEEAVSSHLRKGIKGDWRNHFTEPAKQAFKDRFGYLLIKEAYERNLEW